MGTMSEESEVDASEPASRKERCGLWMRSPVCSVYLMKALSSWGDRMWMFAVGLYLVKLSNVTLTLTAIYGLTGGACVILLGALVGDWVDKNPRLKVARTSLVIQNSAVIVCAVILIVVLTFYHQILTVWPVHLANICSALIIGTAIVSKLASIATKIAVEKDWVVVMADGDKQRLATMNASMRRIDLLCNILAPALVGQVMSFASMVAGAVVIAGWNLLSVFLEYYLLWKIYKAVPKLAVKGAKEDKPAAKDTDTEPAADVEKGEADQLVGGEATNTDRNTRDEEYGETETETGKRVKANHKKKKSLFELVFGRFIAIYKGWRVYLRQKVLPVGLAYSCEFMTILAFDSITSGFAYSQGLAEFVIGLLMAAGAITGVAGTFVFPVLRPRVGLEKTGLVAFIVFIACLTLCVASIWAPGSPFDPTFSQTQAVVDANRSCPPDLVSVHLLPPSASEGMPRNDSIVRKRSVKRSASFENHFVSLKICDGLDQTAVFIQPENFHKFSAIQNPSNDVTFERHARAVPNDTAAGRAYSTSGLGAGASRNCSDVTPKGDHSFFSIGLLMAGIVCARFGLWLSDLTITQVFQENVPETERGVVGGVQSSLNMLMDVIRYAMVVIAPRPETYGILILISFLSICTGACFFAYYVRKTQGYLFVQNCLCYKSVTKTASSEEIPKANSPVTEL